MARGDHLFVHCLGYSHHGIEVGEDRVVHFDSDPWRKIAAQRSSRPPRICETTLRGFTQGRPVYTRQYDLSDDPERVVQRAYQRIDEQCYDLFDNNCEHFAVWCKTGQHHSTQVEAVVDATKPAIKGVATAALILRSSRYLPATSRKWAYGAALAVTAGAFATRYVENRIRSMVRGES